MRFEISYPGGTTHEVELAGHLCVVGRDPGCDIVLNDSKCSRRHAVVEDGPEGVVVRDSASANGIYVNGRKVEKAALRPGDVLRLGDVKLRLMAEIGETVVVAPESIDFDALRGPVALGDSGISEANTPIALPPAGAAPTPIVIPPLVPPAPAVAAPPVAPSPRPPQPRPARPPRPQARAARGPARPATVSLLAVLWALFVPTSVAGAVAVAARLSAGWIGWTAATAAAVVFAGLGTSMALGLRALAPWARHLQIAAAAIGLLVCPFSLAAAPVIFYMSRQEVRDAFEGRTDGSVSPDSAEPTFALSLVGMLLVGFALTAIAVIVL